MTKSFYMIEQAPVPVLLGSLVSPAVAVDGLVTTVVGFIFIVRRLSSFDLDTFLEFEFVDEKKVMNF
ncbi:9635_t:CDS:2, partial [Funneliformis geosporum]